jgi:hypothetical protein
MTFLKKEKSMEAYFSDNCQGSAVSDTQGEQE